MSRMRSSWFLQCRGRVAARETRWIRWASTAAGPWYTCWQCSSRTCCTRVAASGGAVRRCCRPKVARSRVKSDSYWGCCCAWRRWMRTWRRPMRKWTRKTRTTRVWAPRHSQADRWHSMRRSCRWTRWSRAPTTSLANWDSNLAAPFSYSTK